MSEKDTFNLRYDNWFSTKIYKDMFWVPIRELGDSRYSTSSMRVKKQFLPEEKYRFIRTLYEAVQLFQCSDFKNVDDISRVEDNGKVWENYKSGYQAVLTNEGSCASCTNWLIYMLQGKYEKIGALCYIRPWATGHCMNYIYHAGWYYIIDMQLQESEYIKRTAQETGQLKEYLRSRPFANIFFKARSLETYMEYIAKYQKFYGDSFLFLKEDTEVMPVAVEKIKDEIHVLLPKSNAIEVCNYNRSTSKFTYEFVDLPNQIMQKGNKKAYE